MKKVAVVIHGLAEERRNVVAVLAGPNVQVLDFGDTAQALDYLIAHDPVDLIVSDLHLPQINGWQLCRLLRAPDFIRLNQIPLVILSATFSGADVEALTLELGAHAMLAWPGDPRTLRHVAGALLQGETPRQTPRALVVEDDPSMRQLLKRLFSTQGYSCAEAANGAEARMCLSQGAWDLVVLDYHLPDEAGEDLIKNFSAPGSTAAVVVVTGDPDPQVAVRILKAGADSYVRKPFHAQHLVRLCQHVRRERSFLRAEKLLEQRTRQLRLTHFAMENAADAVFWIEPDARLSYVNESACRLLGCSRSELMAKHLYDVDNLLTRERWEEHWRRLREAGVLRFESQYSFAAGRQISVEVHSNYLLFEGREYNFAFVRDITERKQLQRDLLTAEKMDSIGRLAGGIAHDFNNALQTILGFSDILLESAELPLQRKHDLQEIRNAALRVARLTNQLLAYGQKQMIAVQILDLNHLLRELQYPLRDVLGPAIDLHMNLDPQLCRIKADPVYLEQVIRAIAENAREAMPQGGRLTLSTANIELQANDVEMIRDAHQGQYARLAISDTGLGMRPELLQHVFEPFFSTKKPGVGIGMGLAMAYGVIKQHDGWINVYSEPGQGTVFKTYLPAFSALPSVASPPDSVGHRPTGKILLVEDEASIVGFAEGLLRSHGFDVCSVTSAAEAQEVFAREPELFALLFSDVVLPDQNGLFLAAKLRAQQSGLKVLLTSGYTDEKTRWPEIALNHYAFIPKPYPSAALLEQVQKLLA